MRRLVWLLGGLAGVLLVLLWVLPRVYGQNQRCFPETGQCISGRFLQYWQANGGLPVFGIPLTPAREERNRDTGKTYLTQWFERNRFELHSDQAAPYDVLLGRLGDDRLQQQERDWRTFPKASPQAAHYFAQTGHAIAPQFWERWSTTGLDLGDRGVSEREALALWGYPVSEPQRETNAAGDTVLTQWFERARFESHPDKAAPFNVLFGLLGTEVRAGGNGSQPPAASPTRQPAASPTAQQITLSLEEVASGFRAPLFVTHAGDGSNRAFVVEKGGVIRLLADGQTFLDITDRVNARGSEQGLLGLAFHPRFRDNGYFYVNYINANGDTVISRFNLAPDKRAADPRSEKRILLQEQPASNHNGGMIAFGPDGYLYIGLGDGGGANDTYRNGQNRQSLLGKLLRIDVNSGDPYSVPADNPFVSDRATRPEIWAYGLRNPWRFSFDRANGDLYIGDVGQNRYEWVHYQPAGRGGQNYGWPTLEGSHCLQGNSCNRNGLTLPVAEYGRDLGSTITGGYVYRGTRHPQLQGRYLFGDFGSGRIWTLARNNSGQWNMTEQIKSNVRISSFGEDEAGEIYLTDLSTGRIYRVAAR